MNSKRVVGILLVIVIVVLCAVSLTACLSAIGLGLLSALLGTNSTDLSEATMTLSQDTYTYDGKACTPTATVKLGSTTLKEGTDYTLSYSDNINAGKGMVTATALGTYTGTCSAYFTINAISLEGATVTASNTQVEYSPAGAVNTYSVVLNDKTLRLNSDYAITYENNDRVGTATATISGINNYSGSITSTFEVTALSLTNAVITLSKTKYKYTGEAVEPELVLTINGDEIDSNNYNIAYTNNIEIGDAATITITGKNNCTGSVSTTFTITDQIFHTITFYSESGSIIKTESYVEGEQTYAPDQSTIEKAGVTGLVGYSYTWYSNTRYSSVYTFGTMPDRDVSVYGKLQQEQGYSFLVYDFYNWSSGNTIDSTEMLQAFVDYIAFNYVSSDTKFYQYVGDSTFDSTNSYMTLSASLLSSLKRSYSSPTVTAALEKAIDAYLTQSTFAVNTRKDIVLNMAGNSGIKFYIVYYVSDEAAIEGTSSATNEVIEASATNLNYTTYKTLNVDLNSGSNHTLAIDSAKYSLQVTTSNQLAFCLEHGAKPIFTSTTCSAYKCYQAAITVLNQICNNTMSDYDKALAIYTWIIDNVQYDYNAVTYGEDNSYGYNLKTNYWMYYDAYYLEGVFALNGTRVAVCDGMAKAYTLMCQMEGINCVRVTGSVSSGSTSGGHAWNRVYLDGKWYILDTTWGGASNASKKSLLNEECPTGESVNYSYFLVAENDSLLSNRTIYSNGNWRATGNIDYFSTSKFYVDVDGDGIDEDYSFYITNVDQLTALFLYCILYTDSNGDYMGIDGYTIQFSYSGSVIDSMQTALTNAKAIADERVGFEKNFNTAFPFNYDTSEGTYTLVFTGTYQRAAQA